MGTVIKVENVSKLYSLKDVGVATMKSDFQRFWANLSGKEDPAIKLAEANDRNAKGNSDFIWALKNINFEVKQGEVLGILGKNGAGKSTLLKILSRVAAPTTGSIKMKGRLASLLEVGTGFHPDLSGRENIFLNGSILGMTKAEIKKNFDEIVDFSGIGRYIDTPVKRYSSGMYVRLAFAVAAHLESEILIIDEVLAVGDAEFQKKCIGKMKDVSGEGRTVLFVSHNIDAVQKLTQNAVLLKNGEVLCTGATNDVIKEYLQNTELNSSLEFENPETALGNNFIKIKSVKLLGAEAGQIKIDQELIFEVSFWNLSDFEELAIGFDLYHYTGTIIFGTGDEFKTKKNSLNTIQCRIPANFLNTETYHINLMFFNKQFMPLFAKPEIISFEIKDKERDSNFTGKINGLIRPKFNWEKI